MIYDSSFFLTRHAESKLNMLNITCGSIDSDITQKGIIQAHNLGKMIASINNKPKIILHTGLIRTKKTALIINEYLNIKVGECQALKEHSFGDWEGLPWEIVVKNLDEGVSPPNGESRKNFILRINKEIKSLLFNIPTPPLIVAHGGTFYAIGRHYNINLENINNCQLYFFKIRFDTNGGEAPSYYIRVYKYFYNLYNYKYKQKQILL